jgi:3-deoxy-D-manno-octulosonic acid kinase
MNHTSDRRKVTARGAMLIDSDLDWTGLGEDSPFETARGGPVAASRGRGAAWFLETGGRPCVLKHYRRGGLMARALRDRYLWLGEARVRSFAEFELLAALCALALPVPRPLAARYERAWGGLIYRCDLITERIAEARPLSEWLSEAALPEDRWRRIGATVGSLHEARVDHADLNAHNVLIDQQGLVSVIDFDRGRVRGAPGRWMGRNLARLERSLHKIARSLPADRFTPVTWSWLLAGYASG